MYSALLKQQITDSFVLIVINMLYRAHGNTKNGNKTPYCKQVKLSNNSVEISKFPGKALGKTDCVNLTQ